MEYNNSVFGIMLEVSQISAYHFLLKNELRCGAGEELFSQKLLLVHFVFYFLFFIFVVVPGVLVSGACFTFIFFMSTCFISSYFFHVKATASYQGQHTLGMY